MWRKDGIRGDDGMIEINFTGMCEGCQNADLEAHRLITHAGYKWVVLCSHNNACERMKAKMEAKW